MGAPVGYALSDGVARITMDDGKVNVLSPEMLEGLDRALDRAESDEAVVVLAGRPGVLSAGFDLAVLRAGGRPAVEMLRAGFDLARRLLAHPRPVMAACTGNTVAMGAFLLLSADYRLGATGTYKIVANEVAIGITMPRAAIEICRQRLSAPAFDRTVLLSETFDPEGAVRAGFLDRLVDPSKLDDEAMASAVQLRALDMAAHAASKQRARQASLEALDVAIAADDAEVRKLFALF